MSIKDKIKNVTVEKPKERINECMKKCDKKNILN